MCVYRKHPVAETNGHRPADAAPTPFDGTEIAQKVLSAVVRTGGRFGAAHIVNVLRGSRSRRVLELGHDKLSVYGIAKGMPRDELRDVIDQLASKGLIAIATGDYPTLGVTEQGMSFLKNRESVTLRQAVQRQLLTTPARGSRRNPIYSKNSGSTPPQVVERAGVSVLSWCSATRPFAKWRRKSRKAVNR